MSRTSDLLAGPGGQSLVELGGLQPVSAPLPWQGELWAHLSSQLASGQLPHAIILTGSAGIGKKRFALALARLLLCHGSIDGLNCGKCPACDLSAAGNHGDLRWLQPEEKSRVIKIDQIRQVVEFANKTPGYGARKVLVISPADGMNKASANALLKCLEEPPRETYFLLVGDHLQSLPATVRSRCRIQRMAVPPQDVSSAWLTQLTNDQRTSTQLLELADQRPLLAEQLFLGNDLEPFAARRELIKALLAGKATALDVAGTLADMPTQELLTELTTQLNALLLSLATDQLQRSRAVFALLDEVRNLQRAMDAGSNPNTQLLTEVLLTRTQQMLGDKGQNATMGQSRGGAAS